MLSTKSFNLRFINYFNQMPASLCFKQIRFSLMRRCYSLSTSIEVDDSNDGTATPPHIPVMVGDVINYLQPENGKTYIDMTFGAGGHSRQLLEAAKDIQIIALDRDPVAYEYAKALSEQYPGQITPLLGKFSDLPKLLKSIEIEDASIDGMLFDFGLSTMQASDPSRGFSLGLEGPLDLRMDKDRCPNNPNGIDVLRSIDELDLVRLLKFYGGEKANKKIARAIVDVRYSQASITTTSDLSCVINNCFDNDYFPTDTQDGLYHHANKTVQALRFFVNNELNEANYGLQMAEKYLKVGGRLVTITYQAQHATIVKRHMEGNVIEGVANEVPLRFISPAVPSDAKMLEKIKVTNWVLMNKHVITPTQEEIGYNPRALTAKLRGAFKHKEIPDKK